MLIPF